MGKRGPAPKPSELKRVEGTYRKDREAPNAPRPKAGIPELPDGWEDAADWRPLAVQEYWHIAPALRDMGLLAKIDRASLLLYCDAWGRWEHWTRKVSEEGAVQYTKTGYEAQRPAVTFMHRALDDVNRYLAKFGLSPSDRTRVTAMEQEADADPEERFFGGPKSA